MRSNAVVVLAVVMLASAIGVAVVGVPGPAATTSKLPIDRVENLHCRGVTGENVTVGVVSTTEFDTTDPALRDRTVAARSFGTNVDTNSDHGTASAALVTRISPRSDLLLAEADSPQMYRDAVEWLLDRNVDVVLIPASFVGTAGHSHRLGRMADQQDAVLVAPTGNLARSHWRGEFEPAGENESRLEFRTGPNDTRLRVRGNASEFSLWLSWNGAPSTAFEASLYREGDGNPELVARSSPYTEDGVSNQLLSADTPPGRYFVVVRGSDNATGTPVTIESPTHELVGAEPRSSITPPATGPNVVAVGAYDERTNDVARFSGRGPTRRGSLGVDVVAPKRQSVNGTDREFVGTSAAASYVAGISALLLDAEPTMDPRDVEVALERTARPTGPPGPDPTTGYGRVSPAEAVASAGRIPSENGQTTTEPMNRSLRSPDGSPVCPS